MMWRVGTLDEQKARMVTPHRWFAWHPVETVDGFVVWLERVWRAAEPWSITWDGDSGPLWTYRVERE